ncbi:MAG: response regulator transcription factor [Prevotellaceae bacterium]|jgi:DNA-binding NarL/FixJ family response regulator|nr:response regulator transcription factor [Prevotellaceae bacterium]
MRTFILADNQDITREGLVSLLNRLAIAGSVFTVSDSRELKEKLAAAPEAAVILDYTLFDFSETSFMNMKQKYPKSLWLLFSEHLSKHFLRQALFSKQQFAVVMKTDSLNAITVALQYAAIDKIYLCDIATQILDEDIPVSGDRDKLTASERLVLYEIALGKTTKEIAFEKNLSFHTINTHRKNIFHKLEVNNVHDAIRFALRAGIIDLTDYYI